MVVIIMTTTSKIYVINSADSEVTTYDDISSDVERMTEEVSDLLFNRKVSPKDLLIIIGSELTPKVTFDNIALIPS